MYYVICIFVYVIYIYIATDESIKCTKKHFQRVRTEDHVPYVRTKEHRPGVRHESLPSSLRSAQ